MIKAKINRIFLETLNRNVTDDEYNIYYKHALHNNYNIIRESLQCNYMFVPRDAGFFSVFNYFIGLVHSGYKVYPYWNYSKTLEINKRELRHFCYMDKTIDNSWFEYFEPIKYYKNDENNLKNNFKIIQGEETPKEFKYVNFRQNLQMINNFSVWRRAVNLTYNQYIKVNKNILKIVDDTIKSDEDIIGVHYRHPSHHCEQGKVYFKDYFEKIDNILIQFPDAKIFLASDNDLGIIVFKDRYKEKIIYNQDVKRTSVDNILEWSFASLDAKSDKLGFINNVGYQSHYDAEQSIKMGKDVLIDALCLSKCRWLVHAVSNITFAVSYINPNIELLYVNSVM